MRSFLFAVAGILVASAASAQTLTVSPIPDDAENRFCYYAGVTYSENGIITIDVPFRRESPQALQKRELVCTRDGETGVMKWVAIDIERQGLSNN